MLKKIFSFLNLANDSTRVENNGAYFTSLLNNDLSKSMNSGKLSNYLSEYYLNESSSLAEKKYKLLCLHIFLDNKDILLASMPSVEKKVASISKELLKNKETKYNLENLFNKNIPSIEMSNAYKMAYLRELQEETDLDLGTPKLTEVYVDDIIKEGKENLDIARKIYQDFNNCGILADKLRKDGSNLHIILDLQNYKLEENDYKSLDKYLEDGNVDYYINPNTSRSIWSKLINNENSIENLTKIKKFIIGANRSSFGFYTNEDDEKEIMKQISVKIEYIELKGDLADVKLDTPKPKKLKI